jgi:hypothetical protein
VAIRLKGWDKFTKQVAKLVGKSRVKVGVFGDGKGAEAHDGKSGATQLELMVIHEYGAPKAGIPARYPMKSGARAIKDDKKFQSVLAKVAKGIVTGKLLQEQAIGIAGETAAAFFRSRITSGKIKPKLKPATIKAKGSSKPLIDTGRLVQSITWVKED